MQFNWISGDGVRVAAIVGICKNAGKTSLLNSILSAHPSIRFGILSTGIDGEETDLVFGNPKPSLCLAADTIFCCDTQTLDAHGSAVEVLAAYSGSASRTLWLAKSKLPLQTRVTGPATVTEQIEVCRMMLDLGADKVIADGALDRKSIALSYFVDAVVVVLGAAFGSAEQVEEETRRLLLLNSLPYAQLDAHSRQALLDGEEIRYLKDDVWHSAGISSLIDADASLQELDGITAEAIYIPGAVTDSTLPKLEGFLSRLHANLIFRHPDCLKLKLSLLVPFTGQHKPMCLIPFHIAAFALNASAPALRACDAPIFRDHIRKAFPHITFIDIMEI